MAGWSSGEHDEVIARARSVVAESVGVRRWAQVVLQRTREESDGRPDELADRRFEEMNELIENLTKRLESQPVIEQAKGILMARSHCTPEEAFEMLRRASMRMNRKLRQVAADIVAATSPEQGTA